MSGFGSGTRGCLAGGAGSVGWAITELVQSQERTVLDVVSRTCHSLQTGVQQAVKREVECVSTIRLFPQLAVWQHTPRFKG